ncbi:hypothetical protein L249_4272 [Ophiocordyceps polyrhachis-furcata BCC 54312]|uniref:Uncharacterized protein n=1 Tax=Ophiocordyceps polyrhachis-furcata BCC 54312 TaxID=1330021 RepID=A0A367L7Q5_9HYPO|nr:hypothetical protein L249_4272 [Ophiocordyceps polyrhachis-furcata BCC 54312]
MWGKSGAVEEEEGVEIIMSNRGVDYVIEKKKTNHVIYSAPIDVTAAFPTVTQGVIAGLRPNWYNLF